MIIVLTGQKRTGKSTAANFLKENGFKSLALADGFKPDLAFSIHRLGIRQFCYMDANGETNFDREEKIFNKKQVIEILQHAFLGILGDDQKYHYVDPLIEEYITQDQRELYSFREVMQICGTDIGCNEIDQKIWVTKVLDKIIYDNNENFVISDCRQDHELDVFRKLGFKIIHIKRDTSGLVRNDNHITEKPLNIKEKDIIINNDSSLDDFLQKISQIIKE